MILIRFILSFLLLALAATAFGADLTEPEKPLAERVAVLTAKYRAGRPFGALAVGVIQNGRKESFGFGEIDGADASDKTAVDGRTLFEIGSCTKVFTSLSLAVLVSRGDLRLEDPLRTVFPSAELSDDAAKITLKELSTHMAGLPRIPLGLYVDAFVNSDNPYKNYGGDRLLGALKAWKAPEDKSSSYSNMGAGLLGYALQQRVGVDSYEALIQATVTGPLGLRDTVVALDEDHRARYAVARDPKGKVVKNWDFIALAGAGALRSSADDLLAFLEFQIRPETSPLKEAIVFTQEVHYERQPGRMGLGWQIADKDKYRLHWHNGATGGYRSFFGFDRASGAAVVLLSNSGDGLDNRIDKMGFEILKAMRNSLDVNQSPE